MIGQTSLLVTLVLLVERLPLPPPPAKRGRGRPVTYPDRLFRKALAVMIVRQLHTVHELLTALRQPTAEMGQLRALLVRPDGRFPTRRTRERRLAAPPAPLPAQIACLGRHLVAPLAPGATRGRAGAIDSTVLRAKGGVGHKKDREAGVAPHTSIATEAHWTKSGWHGWVYGRARHRATTVAGVRRPLAAELTPANAADNQVAPLPLAVLPAEVRRILGDHRDGAPHVRARCERGDRTPVASRQGGYPHTDDGVAVRRVFHTLRSTASEDGNEHPKGRFDAHGAVPTRGLAATRRFAPGAVLVYQRLLWQRHEHGLDLRRGRKPALKAA